MIEDFKLVLRIEHFNYFFVFFFFYVGRATFRMPSSIGPVVSVPSGIGPVRRNPGAATMILCRRGSFALITHLGT